MMSPGFPFLSPELSDSSPPEAVFGSPLVLPGEFPAFPEDSSSHFLANLQASLSGAQIPLPPPPPASDIPLPLITPPFVFLLAPPSHHPLSPSYSSPYKGLRKFPHTFLLQMADHIETISVSSLKPFHLPPNTPSTQPPLRGCHGQPWALNFIV